MTDSSTCFISKKVKKLKLVNDNMEERSDYDERLAKISDLAYTACVCVFVCVFYSEALTISWTSEETHLCTDHLHL